MWSSSSTAAYRLGPLAILAGVLSLCSLPTLAATPEEVVLKASGRRTNIKWDVLTAGGSEAQREIAYLYSRIADKCKDAGGTFRSVVESSVSVSDGRARSGQVRAPGRMLCEGGSDGLWGADLSYRTRSFRGVTNNSPRDDLVEFALTTNFLSADQIASLAEAEAAARAAAERAKQELTESRRQAAASDVERERDRKARAPAFRSNLKVGDRVRMQEGVREYFGLVIEVKRPIAQVQFSNVTFAGSPTTWVEIERLEPEN